MSASSVSKERHTSLTLWKTLVGISAIQTVVLCDFPKFLQANVVTEPTVEPRLLSSSFTVYYLLINLSLEQFPFLYFVQRLIFLKKRNFSEDESRAAFQTSCFKENIDDGQSPKKERVSVSQHHRQSPTVFNQLIIPSHSWLNRSEKNWPFNHDTNLKATASASRNIYSSHSVSLRASKNSQNEEQQVTYRVDISQQANTPHYT